MKRGRNPFCCILRQKKWRKCFGCYDKWLYFCSISSPKPLHNAQIGGRFIFTGMATSFHKHYCSPSQIIELLQNRGLIIGDTLSATRQITNIGHYRFSAYLYPLLATPKENQMFKPQSKFETALSLYRFDQDLRSLVFRWIAEIEVAVRSALANIIAKETNNMFWMTDSTMYRKQERFQKTLAIIDKELNVSREEFIDHFKHKYSNPYPPAWILVEILPMGVLNHIYSNLADNTLCKKVAAHFSLTVPVFSSWLTVIILTRNACCHHARMWNKENAIPPVEPRRMSLPWIASIPTTRRFYFNLCVIKYFLDRINDGNSVTHELENLLATYPMIDTHAMGFPTDWQDEALWQ